MFNQFDWKWFAAAQNDLSEILQHIDDSVYLNASDRKCFFFLLST